MITALIPSTGDPRPQRLSFDQINEWNKYMQSKPQGSDLLSLYANYKKQNPKTTISFDTLRNELDLLLNKERDQAKRQNLVIANEAHTGNMFPQMRIEGGQSLGAVNGDMRSQIQMPTRQMPQSMIKPLPDDVDEIYYDKDWNQPYYKDGNDIVYVDKKYYNSPRFLKPQGMMSGLIAKK